MIMYTVTIFILLIISIIYCIYNRKNINWNILSLFIIICSFYSYVEFYFCNTYDSTPAWMFSENAIIGIRIFTIPIEDILFSPIFAIFFYAIYQLFSVNRNILEKYVIIILSFVIIMIGILLFLYSGIFGKYSSIRLFVIITLFTPYCKFKIKQMVIFCLIISLIAFLWDLWALNTFQWMYRNYFTGINSIVFNDSKNNWLLIWKAWFPLEIFFYYVNGSIFGYFILNFLTNYFTNRYTK